MWYPARQYCQQSQQQSCHGYVSNLLMHKQQQQQNYPRTLYHHSIDESLTTDRPIIHSVPRNDNTESFIHYQSKSTEHGYGADMDYCVTNSNDSYSNEMSPSLLPYQTSNTITNSVINGPRNSSHMTNRVQENHIPNVTSSSTADCWDWLLYPPKIYSNLYTPSSIIIQQYKQDDDLDLLASLPSWLLALLCPSMKDNSIMEDENESNQEVHAFNNNHDEASLSINIDKKFNQVSSNLLLSSENTHNCQKLKQNRSSTPDTDDGYQSSSDASRSDYYQQSLLHYDHQHSKDDVTSNAPLSLMPKRISYAAACKPMASLNTDKLSSLSTPIIKTKTDSASTNLNDMLNNNIQKLKFVAPRFERMHHAKQCSSSTMPTRIHNSSSSSSTPSTNRGSIRSKNNYTNTNQRHHHMNSARRR